VKESDPDDPDITGLEFAVSKAPVEATESSQVNTVIIFVRNPATDKSS